MLPEGSGKASMISKAAVTLNGITIAYVMGFVNAALAALLAFGVHLSDAEIASLAGLINAGMVLAVHIGHRVGEATASGAAAQSSQLRTDNIGIAAERRGLALHDAGQVEQIGQHEQGKGQ